MIDTILFDLDGTLLPFSQRAFVDAYFAELGKTFARLGLDVDLAVAGIWGGTKAMLLSDGSRLNIHTFWRGFAEHTGFADDVVATVEASCDDFYLNEFNAVRSVMAPGGYPGRLVRAMVSRGYGAVLATNPFFPLCAVESRLAWIGLEARDFLYVSHYANSSFCKPNPAYYQEIFRNIGKSARQCLMVGNNPAEDMVAGTLGAEVFLVTDYVENEAGVDVAPYRKGTFAELEEFLLAMPPVGG